MLDVVFRPAAEDDLSAIADYTKAEWGERQAKEYAKEIRRKISFAAEYPGIGSPLPGLPPDFRRIPAGSHRIIYRQLDHRLVVVRIIHEREVIPEDWDEYW